MRQALGDWQKIDHNIDIEQDLIINSETTDKNTSSDIDI